MQITQIQQYTGHRGSIYAMVADAQEAFLYTSGDDGVVAKWDIDTAEAKAVLQTDSAVYAMALAEDLGILLVGTRNGTVYVTDIKNNKLLHSFRKYTHAIYEIAYDENTKNAWILCAEGHLIVWNVVEMREVHSLRVSDKHLRCILPYKKHKLIGASDGMVYMLDQDDLSLHTYWQAHENSVFCLYMPMHSSLLFSGGRDAHLNVWDIPANFQNLQKIPAHNYTINAIAQVPQTHYLATASRDKTIKIWDSHDFSLQKVIDFARNQGHLHSVNKLCALNEKKILISCGDDKKIIAWKIDS